MDKWHIEDEKGNVFILDNPKKLFDFIKDKRNRVELARQGLVPASLILSYLVSSNKDCPEGGELMELLDEWAESMLALEEPEVDVSKWKDVKYIREKETNKIYSAEIYYNRDETIYIGVVNSEIYNMKELDKSFTPFTWEPGDFAYCVRTGETIKVNRVGFSDNSYLLYKGDKDSGYCALDFIPTNSPEEPQSPSKYFSFDLVDTTEGKLALVSYHNLTLTLGEWLVVQKNAKEISGGFNSYLDKLKGYCGVMEYRFG